MKLLEGDPTTLILHQSDIKHFMTCPEQFRVVNGVLPGGGFEPNLEARMETDAATVGTVFHAVVEHDLTASMFKTLKQIEDFATKTLGDLIKLYVKNEVPYSTESFGADPAVAIRKLKQLVGEWFHSEERRYWQNAVQDHRELVHFEWNFRVPFISNRSGRYKNIMLSGTADVLDCYEHRLVDWKTSSQTYQRWEKQRWDVQSTTYTYAAHSLGLLDRHDKGFQFDFKVFTHRNKDIEPQTVTVYRTEGQWSWLVQQVSNMVATIESDIQVWPVRDDHALCGPKWCPIWDSCKGLYVTEEWT